MITREKHHIFKQGHKPFPCLGVLDHDAPVPLVHVFIMFFGLGNIFRRLHQIADELFACLPVENALFDMADYDGVIVSDLFDDERYFDDAAQFWTLQNAAIASLKDKYLSDGWQDVVVLDAGEQWARWDHCKAPKEDGGRVYIRIGRDGEVSAAEGYITEKEAKRRKKAKEAGAAGSGSGKPELTKSMQNYLDLHRHAAVRKELLSNSGLALRVAAAQIIAGSYIWQVNAEPQKASTESHWRQSCREQGRDGLCRGTGSSPGASGHGRRSRHACRAQT